MSLDSLAVKVSADTVDFTAGMNRAAQVAENAMRRTEQAHRIAQQASDKFIRSLQTQVDTFGKTEAEILRYRASLVGASDAAEPLIKRLEQMQSTASDVESNAKSMEHFGFHTAAAKRELLVLAHELSQGNFKRFAGSVLVLGERTGAAALLFNPLALGIIAATGALALMGREVYKGYEQWEALNKSIRDTNEYTGLTAHQLDDLAVHFVRSTTDITAGKEAIVALVATGRIGGDQLAGFGRVAVDMAKNTGQSMEEVAKELAKISDGAYKWAEAYNKQHHALNGAQVELIGNLDKEGRQAEATAVLIKALQDAQDRMTEKSKEQLGSLQRWWNEWGVVIDKVKRGIMSIGVPDSIFDQLNSALKLNDQLQSSLKTMQGRQDAESRAQIPAIQRQIDANLALIATLRKKQDAEKQSAQEAAKTAQSGDNAFKVRDYIEHSVKTPAEQRKKAIEEENRAYQQTIANLDKNSKEYEEVYRHHLQNLADINERYKPKKVHDDAGAKFLESLRDQDAAIQAQLASTDKLVGAQKQLAEFEQKIHDLKGKKLTDEQKSLLANQDAIRAQLDKNIADEKELRLKQEIEKLDERSAQINQQIASLQERQNEGYQAKLGAFGKGKAALGYANAIAQITKEYQRYQDELIKATPKDLLGSQEFLDEQAKIRAGLQQSLAEYQAYYAALQAKQMDWSNGASAAFANYLDNAQNVAQQTEQMFTTALNGITQGMVNLVMTGKASFSDLAKSIIADLLRIQMQKAIAGLIDMMTGTSAGTGTYDEEMGRISAQLAGETGTRAAGGPVGAYGSYLVGEKGPEILNMGGTSGTIIPNDQLGGGASVTYAPTINIDSRTDRQEVYATVSRMVKQGNAQLLDKLQRQGKIAR